MRNFLLFSILIVAGCSSRGVIGPDPSIPYPVTMALFPVLEEPGALDNIMLDVLFYVRHDGIVEDVALAKPAISSSWDAAAIDSMKKWVFTRPPSHLTENGIWLRRTVKVEFEEPMIMDLVALYVNDEAVADSLFRRFHWRTDLQRDFADPGAHDFSYQVQVERDINISRYPDHVRNELKKLKINGYTRPIRVDRQYVIFQRLERKADLL